MNSLLPSFVAVAIIGQMALSAQSLPTPATPIVLWSEGAPGALGTSNTDIPTLTAYFPPPELVTGAAMVICPGGGYGGLAPHEGKDYALWLNEQGIAGFVPQIPTRFGWIPASAHRWRMPPARCGWVAFPRWRLGG